MRPAGYTRLARFPLARFTLWRAMPGLLAVLGLGVLAARSFLGIAVFAQERRLPVVVTFSVLGDVVQNVGGDAIALTTLVGPDGEIHDYEPTPSDARALAEAAVLVENGLGVETWIDRLYAASRSSARRLVVSDGIEPLRIDNGARQGEVDPHIWHDPLLVMHVVLAVRDAFSQADPARAELYAANAAAYLIRLQELDTWIREQVASIPPAQRKLVTAHDTFGYFARRYGFEIVGFAIPSFAPGAQPSARELAALAAQIREAGVPAVFPDNVSNRRFIERVAAEARVGVAPALYTDSLGGPNSAGSTYLRMMQYNVSTIVSALRAWR